MNIKPDDIIRFDGEKCFVLVTLQDSDKNYAFVNKITEDEMDVTNEYYLIEETADGSLVKIVDQELINKLTPKIQELLEKSLSDLGVNIED